MIQEIIVVEGRGDTAAVQRAVQAETIETGGSAIGEPVLRRIELAQARRGVIILTDPDHAGERIRRIVSQRVPGCKHAFLPRELAEHKGDIGVENASPATIRRILEEVKSECPEAETVISWEMLMDAGLITHPQAAARRARMGALLGIGHANGKQFYKRCRMFRIGLDEFIDALARLEAETGGQVGKENGKHAQ